MGIDSKDGKSIEKTEAQPIFDPTRVITSPKGNPIAEMYGLSDEQAAALKVKAAERNIDLRAREESGIDFERRLDNVLDTNIRRVEQLNQSGLSGTSKGVISDPENNTRIEFTLGNTQADKIGGTDYTMKIIAIVAVVIIVAILALK